MFKKILLVVLIFALLAGTIGYVLAKDHFVNMIRNSDHATFESVFNNDTLLSQHYHIENHRDPGDYGYENWEEVSYPSSFDDIQLNGWFVQSSKSDSCILLIHGRGANRLKPMKYLALFRDTGLDSLYNFFIPDLRNSGKSQSSETAMGYESAEDILASIQFAHREFGQTSFIPYAFSMGAQASAVLLDREDIKEELSKMDVQLLKIIFDSPLSNVYENILYESKKISVPGFLFEAAISGFDETVDGYVDRMKFSTSLKNIPYPVLILQSKEDEATPWYVLEKELGNLPEVELQLFENGPHVGMFVMEEHKEVYTSTVVKFLQR